MRNTFRHRRAAAIFGFDICSGRQVVVSVAGPVTPSVLRALGADVDRVASGVLAKSIVVDWTRAAIAVSYEELVASPATLSLPVRVLPIAIVPASGLRETFRELAWEHAKLGLVRGVFAAQDTAQDWAHRSESLALLQHCRIPESAR
jgi:hypothetical protein